MGHLQICEQTWSSPKEAKNISSHNLIKEQLG